MMMTAFDQINQTKELSLLKTILPYIGDGQKELLILMIHFMEYQNTIQSLHSQNNALAACSFQSETEKRTKLLNDIKPFCSDSEKAIIDNLLNVLNLWESYGSIYEGDA